AYEPVARRRSIGRFAYHRTLRADRRRAYENGIKPADGHFGLIIAPARETGPGLTTFLVRRRWDMAVFIREVEK
ncbi:hypothetical protein, partial [Klebsiella pneumoniae]|uniref:hypothetical protein n=1 Tax=Klebsiella pneumoniae TaxID=573 RepID=UPI003B5959CD